MISTNKPGALGTNDRVQANQLQQGINRRAGVVNVSDQVPPNMVKGSMAMAVGTGGWSMFQGVGSGPPIQKFIPDAIETYAYIDPQSGAVPPTVADNFPEEGDYGWYLDTVSGYTYWVLNSSSTLKTPSIQTLAGELLSAQHGNLSAATASTMHSFPQITGSITAAQHGNFTAATANDSLHALATSQFNGFLSSSGFSLLANATNASTPDNLVRRTSAGNANFRLVNLDSSTSQLLIDGVKVAGTRETGWGTVTGTLTRGAYTVATVAYTGTAASTYNQTQIQDLMDATSEACLEIRRVSQRFGAMQTDGKSFGWIGV